MIISISRRSVNRFINKRYKGVHSVMNDNFTFDVYLSFGSNNKIIIDYVSIVRGSDKRDYNFSINYHDTKGYVLVKEYILR